MSNMIIPWAGNKRWMSKLQEFLFTETFSQRWNAPFCGALSDILEWGPRSAILNDINYHLINLLEQVQKGFVNTHPCTTTQEYFLSERTRFNESYANKDIRTQEAAELFYYLVKTSFGFITRYNSKGFWGSSYRWDINIKYQRDFSEFVAPMKNWEFTSTDFRNVTFEINDFVFLDPPYDGGFKDYWKTKWAQVLHEEVIKIGSVLDNPVVVTNRATDRIMELLDEYQYEYVFYTVKRKMNNAKGKGERIAPEVIAFRNIGKELVEDGIRLLK